MKSFLRYWLRFPDGAYVQAFWDGEKCVELKKVEIKQASSFEGKEARTLIAQFPELNLTKEVR